MPLIFLGGIDSHPLFDKLRIGKSRYYKDHINQHHVIYLDFSELPYGCETYKSYIDFISGNLTEDLAKGYPELRIVREDGPWVALDKIFTKTGHKFIFVMDEWDSMFHNSKFTKSEQEEFLQFLKSLLKSKAYVEFAYMTGVLPIAKYSSGSELNMFDEYNMVTSPKYSNYFGFTEEEVQCIFAKYAKITKNPVLKFEELKEWYNGYQTAGGERIYNPRSVVRALQDNHIGSYWTSSGPYDELFFYISHDCLWIFVLQGWLCFGTQ